MSTQNHIALAQTNSMTLKEITDLLDVRHSNAMITVAKMAESPEFGGLLKISSHYIGNSGQKIPLETYELNKRQSMAVAAKLNTTLLMRVIDRWQELEAQQQPALPKTFAEALRLAADTQEKLEAAQSQIEADKPKVEFAMAVRNLNGSCKVEEFAKVIGYGRNKMFSELRAAGYLQANNQPYQRYIDSGYFVVIENTPFVDRDGNSHPSFTTRITGKGQVALEKKFRKSPKNGLVLLQGGVSA